MMDLHKRIGVTGFVMNATLALKCHDLVDKMNKEGFIVCTYGDPNVEEELIIQQLKMGIKGICSDNIQLAEYAIDNYTL
jgi:glycerophosphoryl diester phosphodiesterase